MAARLSWFLFSVCAVFSLLQNHQAESSILGDTKEADEPSTSTKSRPNFVFILADDLGYGDIGYMGGAAQTPNLDIMAKSQSSINFKYFYSGSPVCSPTRGTVLTGRNHNRYCVWKANTPGECKSREDFQCTAQVYLPSYEVTVADILKREGYKTAIFGKWHLGDLRQVPGGIPHSNPGDNGFDIWKVSERSVPTSTPNCACFNKSLCNRGHYSSPPACTNYYEPSYNGCSHSLLGHDEPILKDDSEFIVDMFESFLQETVSSQEQTPFFVYLPFHAVHTRYVASRPFNTLYASNPALSLDEIDYYGSISALDEAVGRVRELLKAYNISDNTMLWFTSDNGPLTRSPGNTGGLRGGKMSLYEGGIRVPGVIEWPGVINSNYESGVPVVTNDFLPTVCDILNVSPPTDRQLDGVSLLPLIKRESGQRNDSIKWAYNIDGDFNSNYKAAILEGKYKAVAYYRQGKVKKSELYNIKRDKGEQKNLSFQKPNKLKELLEKLEIWRLSVVHSAKKESRCLQD